MELPNDLIPLPTTPYDERPSSLPLSIEECRTALWRAEGNITVASKLLKVTSLRLRSFVQKSPFLSAEMQEANEQIVDLAQNVVVEALTDSLNPGRQDTMARFVLGTQGKSRGWNTSTSGGAVNIKNAGGGTIIVQWGDGTTLGQDNQSDSIIDVTPNSDEAA